MDIKRHIIDLRSDTVTKPTDAMREAMRNADVGDDVYGDDPEVNALEALAAEMLGKEAALFVPTGTFGNQLALFTHCNRGDEAVLSDDCHIVKYEAGAAAVIAGVQLRTIKTDRGVMEPLEIKKRIRSGKDIHIPKTGIICLENALGNGRVVPLEVMKETYSVAAAENIPVHLDGARLFNAAVALGSSAKEIARYTDSVMFCLSKGLCAPAGSVLAGNTEFIGQARRKRKLMGGGMRQAGVLAAPGIIALKEMTERLGEDHANAWILGRLLAGINGVNVHSEDIHINMVYFDIEKTGFPYEKLAPALSERGIVINGESGGLIRFVTHYWVTREDVEYVAEAMREILS